MNRTATPLPLIAAILLAGSGQKVGAKPIPRSLLIGGWVLPGTSCESDAGIVYSKDGTWSDYDESGTWKLQNQRLTLWVTERGEPLETGRKVKGEKPTTSTILSVSKSELVERLDNGKTFKLERCPG